jgi:hypothetical protein
MPAAFRWRSSPVGPTFPIRDVTGAFIAAYASWVW